MTISPGRPALLVGSALTGLVLWVVGGTVAASAQSDDAGPRIIDPLADDQAPPTAADIATSINRLEPDVRRVEIPEPRELIDEEQQGEEITLTISSDVLFAFDSAELSARAQSTIAGLVGQLADVEGPIQIVGHTDTVGTEDYNQDLSQRRAEAVADVLRSELGADQPIETEGRNFREPLEPESEDDPEAAARNRRVEIRSGSD